MLLAMKGSLFTEQILHHGYLVEIDAETSDCLVCHDGSVSSYADNCIKNCNSKAARSVAHASPPREGTASCAPLANSIQVKLRDDKPACISCHDLQNPHKKHLAMSSTATYSTDHFK